MLFLQDLAACEERMRGDFREESEEKIKWTRDSQCFHPAGSVANSNASRCNDVVNVQQYAEKLPTMLFARRQRENGNINYD